MDKDKIPSHVLSTFSGQAEKISDLISKYRIRILSLGGNQNGSYFTKETVDDMCKTLGGVPIIGYYSKEDGDFTGHWGEYITKVVNEETGVTETEYLDTVPYGFVPTNPKIEWETCEEDGEEKQYLVSEAYLWTGRYKELEALNKGRPNNLSMELNPEKTTGEFITVTEKGFPQEYYKFDETEFLGLCILGKDVEPCFPSACFEPTMFSAEISSKLKDTLSQMKVELSEALESYSSSIEAAAEEIEDPSAAPEVEEEEEEKSEGAPTDYSAEGPTEEELNKIEEEESEENFESHSEEEAVEKAASIEHLEAELSTLKEKYRTISEQYSALKTEHDNLLASIQIEKENKEKVAFLEENKDCLSEELYTSFKEHLTDYSLEDLKNKIHTAGYNYMASLIKNKQKNNSNEIISCTYSAEDSEDGLPEWVIRVKEVEKEI